ncbi:MAG: hypothetical protein ACRDTE_27605 [Pseudonocardiaceae bacterium]
MIFNIFVEFENLEKITAEDVEAYLTDDILSIEEVRYVPGKGWSTDPDGWILDLSWRDPGDVNGEYQLSAYFRGDSDIMATFKSRSCHAVRNAIDLALERMVASRSVERVSQAFSEL